MELLQRFTVTFDAPHGRVHLAPNNKLDDPALPTLLGKLRASLGFERLVWLMPLMSELVRKRMSAMGGKRTSPRRLTALR